MNCEYNKKFFTFVTWPYPVSVALIVIGIIPFLLMLLDVRGIWGIVPVGVVFIIAGLVILFAFKSKRADEKALQEDIDKAVKDIKDEAVKALEIGYKDIEFNAAFEPYMMGDFDFTAHDDTLIGKGGDGKYRSNYYSANQLFYTKEGLFIYKKDFCLTSEYMENTAYKIPYGDIKSAETIDSKYKYPVKKTTVTVSGNQVIIHTSENGDVVLTGRYNDSDMDTLVTTINKIRDKWAKEGKF